MLAVPVVLIVDDNLDEAHLLRAACEGLCPQVAFQTAVDVPGALVLLARHAAELSLIVLDYHLGSDTGETVIQQCRKDRVLRGVPLLMLSSELGPAESSRLQRLDIVWERKPADFPAYLALAQRVCCMLDEHPAATP